MSKETAAGKWHKSHEDPPPRDGTILLLRRSDGSYCVASWVEYENADEWGGGLWCDENGDEELLPGEQPEYWAVVNTLEKSERG